MRNNYINFFSKKDSVNFKYWTSCLVMLYLVVMSHSLRASEHVAESFILQETISISGTILDENGIPMIGVTVLQENTSNGVSTDFDGNFTINITPGSNLIFTYVGYKTQTIENITTATNLSITMEPDTASLEEVVIIGYGEQTKQTVVGSVGTVKGEELLKVGSVNTVSEALQGQLPGLTAINTGGKPGSDAANLFIRGRSTFGNSNPLTLVDGVERGFDNLDPNEIESISVLKDAAATAVYGVRGANGVILVTTKRGKLSAPQFNLTANLGLKQPTAKPSRTDYLTAQRAYNEAAFNDRNYDVLIPQSTLTAWEQNYDQRGPNNPYFPEIKWLDELLGTGYEQTYNLNTSGGSKLIKYFVSLGYRNDGDIFQTEKQPEYDPAFGQERYNWRSNFDFNITPTTTLRVNYSGNYRVRTQPGYRIDGGGEDGFGQNQFFQRIFNAPQNEFPLAYPDGFPGEGSDGEGNLKLFINGGGKRTYQYYQGIYDAELDQKLDFITKGLEFKGTLSYTSFSNYEKFIFGPDLLGNFANLNIIRYYRTYDYTNPITAADGTVTYPLLTERRWPTEQSQGGPITAGLPSLYGYNRRLNYRFQTDYKRRFGDHNVSASAIFLRQKDQGRGGYPAKREEWIGRVTYNYKKRYLLEASGNYSGSEQFAPGLRFGFFPAAGAGWVISEEPVIKKITKDWLDFFKVNYSYGVVGNDNVGNNRFLYLQAFDTAGNIQFGYENLTPYGPQYLEGTIANPNATWETSTQQNLKFSLEAFKGFSAELDLYKQDRVDILTERITVPSYVGFQNNPLANIGVTKSRGYELTLGWNSTLGAEFDYYVNLGTAFNENRVLFRDDPRLTPNYQKNAGKPIGWQSRLINGGFYGSLDDIFNGPTQSVGAAQSALVPGDLMFVDFNGDGITDSNDRVAMQDLFYPARTYNLNFGFNWKGFGFNALLYGVTDVAYTIPNNIYFDFPAGNIQAQADVLQRWTPETAETATKPALHLSNNQNTSPSTLLYVDGSYLRLKNIELNYRFENDFLQSFGIRSLQFYANGNNVATWSKLDDRIDPETPGTNTYPIVKRYNLGLRMGF